MKLKWANKSLEWAKEVKNDKIKLKLLVCQYKNGPMKLK